MRYVGRVGAHVDLIKIQVRKRMIAQRISRPEPFFENIKLLLVPGLISEAPRALHIVVCECGEYGSGDCVAIYSRKRIAMSRQVINRDRDLNTLKRRYWVRYSLRGTAASPKDYSQRQADCQSWQDGEPCQYCPGFRSLV